MDLAPWEALRPSLLASSQHFPAWRPLALEVLELGDYAAAQPYYEQYPIACSVEEVVYAGQRCVLEKAASALVLAGRAIVGGPPAVPASLNWLSLLSTDALLAYKEFNELSKRDEYAGKPDNTWPALHKALMEAYEPGPYARKWTPARQLRAALSDYINKLVANRRSRTRQILKP